VALSAALYVRFGVPPGRVVELIARGDPAATTESVTVAVVVWAGEPPSLRLTPKEKLPLPVGFPEMTPIDAARLSPAGRLPEEIDQVYGAVPPAACSALE
jgi:hypothetical protein